MAGAAGFEPATYGSGDLSLAGSVTFTIGRPDGHARPARVRRFTRVAVKTAVNSEATTCPIAPEGPIRIQKTGANARTRTEDLLFTKQLLYH